MRSALAKRVELFSKAGYFRHEPRRGERLFDIDCLDPAFAPGTGTPVVGGLTTYQARRIVCGLGGIDFKGMDLVEVAPQYDVGEVTSLAGASLMFDYIHMMAQGRPVAGSGEES